jgi:5-(carboxyamino)imidazole ribonucleotide synthase
VKLGILGGGQLARMLALAAHPLGIRCTVLEPAPDPSAAAVCVHIQGEYEDFQALYRVAQASDAVTYEFENVPVESARWLAERVPVFPPPRALEVSQDRLVEKSFFRGRGIPTPPFAAVDSREEFDAALAGIGLPAVLKTRRFGYDGKGQAVLRTPADAESAWESLGGRPLIYEGFIRFVRELSLVAARGRSGEVAFYPLVENEHREGMLYRTLAPAPRLSDRLQSQAESHARRVLEHLDYVGVLAIEWFEQGGRLIANEMAPRVHNSGHWTIDAAVTSQFENHVRAVLGLPLGSPAAVGHAAMFNLIGTHPPFAEILSLPGAKLHCYGKSQRPRRKIGHVTLRAEAAGGRDELVNEWEYRFPAGLSGPSQSVQCRAYVWRPHQRLADEHRFHAGGRQTIEVGLRSDAALAHDRYAPGHLGCQFQCVFQPRLERPQVAVVDPHEHRPGIEHPRQLIRVVEFDQNVQPAADGFPVQFGELVPGENLRDENRRVGPGQAGLEQLVAVENELLPQQRQPDRRADRRKVPEVSLEIRLVGQHAEARRPVFFVGLGDGDRVEVGSDDAGRRGCLFHLRDDPHLAGPAERGPELPRRGEHFDELVEFRLGHAGPGGEDLLPLLFDDALEDVGHRRVSVRAGGRAGDRCYPRVGSEPLQPRRHRVPGPASDELIRLAGAFGIVAAGAVPVGLLAWATARLSGEAPFPPWRPWRTRWTGLSLIVLATLSIALPTLAVAASDRSGLSDAWFGRETRPPADAAGAAAGGPGAAFAARPARERDLGRSTAGGLVALPVLLVLFLTTRTQLRAEDAPLSRFVRRLPADVAAGVGAWLVLTPVTFLVHFAATAGYAAAGGEPEEHPLTLIDLGRSPELALLFFTSACFLAPLTEEVIFRRLFLPWALGRDYRPWVLMTVAAAVAILRGAAADQLVLLGPPAFIFSLWAGLFALDRGLPLHPRYRRRVCAAVVATAALFAAMHSSVWPSPVPLFVLGVGLGYLVARTRGVAVAAVCHGLFNAVSAVMLLRGAG